MVHQAGTPMLDATVLSPEGEGLKRPESVQIWSDGSVAVSHRGRGVSLRRPDGVWNIIGPDPALANGAELIPNGIAPLSDGGFLLANIGEGGGVWRLSARGELTPFLMEAEGRPLAAANFVMVAPDGRIWITVSTVSHPRFKAYSEKVADGMIVLVENGEARILADDLCFANECRITPDGAGLVIAETFSRRVSHYELAPDGNLSGRRTLAQFGFGDFPDGIRFDSKGHLWMTSIVANRIWRIAPDGDAELILADTDPDHVDWVENALARGEMGREHFYRNGRTTLGNVASIAFSQDESRAWLGSLLCDRLWHFPVENIIGETK